MSPPPKPRFARRVLTAGLLITIGAIGCAMALGGILSERSLRARALHGEAMVVGYARQVSQRGGELVGEPNALDLRYRDASGATQQAILLRAGNEDLSIGSRFPVLYDPEDASRVRRADREPDFSFLWILAAGSGAMSLLGFALLTRPLQRSQPARPGSDDEIGPLPGGHTPHRFHALAGRPLLETRTASGGADLFAMDAVTGAFLPARDLWPRLRDGAVDLETIEEGLFRQIGREWRRRAMDARTARAVAWEASGDAEYPWRAVLDGHETRIRINDFPAEPLYSVIIAHQSVGELEDWPPTWRKGANREGSVAQDFLHKP